MTQMKKSLITLIVSWVVFGLHTLGLPILIVLQSPFFYMILWGVYLGFAITRVIAYIQVKNGEKNDKVFVNILKKE